MNTENFISMLAVDAADRERPIERTLLLMLSIGVSASAAFFAWQIGTRPDAITVAMQSWEFLFKFVVTLGIVVPAYLLARQAMRPDGDVKSLVPLLIVAPVMLVLAMGYTAMQMAPETVMATVMAPNWSKCVALIALLAVAPFAALFYAMRQGAPANPTVAGAVAGLLSAAIAATLYASHCDMDSPLFVGVWYPLGIAAVTAVGAVAGSRLLRW